MKLRFQSFVGLFPCLVAVFVACGGGDDDPAASPATSTGGTSGSTGTAGKAGTAGSAGTAGKGTSGAGAGGAGQAGAAGSAGSAGDAGASGASGAAGTSGTSGAGGTAGAGGAGAGGAGGAGAGGAGAGGAGAGGAGAGGAGAGGAGAGGAGAGGAGAGGAGAGGAGAGGSSAGAGGSAPGTCGVAPLQHLNLTAQIVLGMPQTPVSVTGNLCAPNSVEIPYQGMVGFDVQKKVPYFLIGTQVGSLPSLTIENNIKIDAFPTIGVSFLVVGPTYPPIINPAWDAATMAMFRVSITSTKSGATAPCNVKSGVTFSVPNHPEAFVKYGGNGTSTGGGGDANAWITVVTSGTLQNPEYVTVIPSKTNCVIGLEATAGFFITGRIPVAINATTAELGLEISNLRGRSQTPAIGWTIGPFVSPR